MADGKKGLKRVLTEQREEIVDFMYSKGCGIEEIAETLELTTQTIRSYLKRLGYKLDINAKSLTETELEKIKELTNQGLTVDEIASRIYRSTKTIRKHLKIIGLNTNLKRNKL